jgi:hypothetical protein
MIAKKLVMVAYIVQDPALLQRRSPAPKGEGTPVRMWRAPGPLHLPRPHLSRVRNSWTFQHVDNRVRGINGLVSGFVALTIARMQGKVQGRSSFWTRTWLALSHSAPSRRQIVQTAQQRSFSSGGRSTTDSSTRCQNNERRKCYNMVNAPPSPLLATPILGSPFSRA